MGVACRKMMGCSFVKNEWNFFEEQNSMLARVFAREDLELFVVVAHVQCLIDETKW